MLVECYDKKGAEVYEIIIKQIFQDLVLGAAVDDLKAFVNPDDPVFILAIKMKKTSTVIEFKDIANFTYDKEKLDRARYSLVLEEFFLIQLKLALLREENNKNLQAIPLEIKKDGLVMKFIDSLPFKLTSAQQRAVNEILNDLNLKKNIIYHVTPSYKSGEQYMFYNKQIA